MPSSIERQLSRALHDEVRGLSFRVTAEQVEARLGRNRRWRTIRRACFVGAAAASVLAVVALVVFAGHHEPIVSATPTPSPTVSAGPSASNAASAGPDESPSSTSTGTITLALDAPASTTVTTPLACEWSSRSHVFYYNGAPVSLFGEQVTLAINAGVGVQPFEIDRPELALYDGTGATYQSDGIGRGTGTIRFQNLTPNPESYPLNLPLPSPLDPFIKPIGGNPNARTLSGTVTWDCGAPPAGLPDADPTPEPVPTAAVPSAMPIESPEAVLKASGTAGSVPGSPWCGVAWYLPDGSHVGGIGECGGPFWSVPSPVLEVKAGSTLTFAIAGFRLAPADVTVAPVARVEYFRGGTPDVTATIRATATAGGTLTCKSPATGDWVAAVHINGTAPDGSTVGGDFFFHIRVSA
jgi:hypothetical protein